MPCGRGSNWTAGCLMIRFTLDATPIRLCYDDIDIDDKWRCPCKKKCKMFYTENCMFYSFFGVYF